MSELANMLEALHVAPRFSTFRGSGTFASDRAMTMTWIESQSGREQQSGISSTPSAAVRVVSASSSVSFGANVPGSAPSEEGVQTWIDLAASPSRWRADQGEAVTVAGGDELVVWRPGGGMRQPRDPMSSRIPLHWESVFAPVSLSAAFRFDAPVQAEVAGRSCWLSRGQRRPPDPLHRIGLAMAMPGDEVEISVDCATGVVLSWTGTHDGEQLASLVFASVEIDEPIPDEVFGFEPPDGLAIPSQLDALREQLRMRGIEPKGESASELRDEMQKAVMAGFGSPTNEDPETRARSFTSTGPPPDDEDDARIDIGLAFQHMADTDASGENLVNVERGEGLGPLMGRAAARYGGEAVHFTVQHIKFLNAVEAMVWFTVDLTVMKLQFEGRARLTESGWKVSRSTIGELLGRAGVSVPPPE